MENSNYCISIPDKTIFDLFKNSASAASQSDIFKLRIGSKYAEDPMAILKLVFDGKMKYDKSEVANIGPVCKNGKFACFAYTNSAVICIEKDANCKFNIDENKLPVPAKVLFVLLDNYIAMYVIDEQGDAYYELISLTFMIYTLDTVFRRMVTEPGVDNGQFVLVRKLEDISIDEKINITRYINNTIFGGDD